MTIAIHWWMLPAAAVLFAVFSASRPGQSDWDFTPMLYAMLWLTAAVALVIGHFV